MPQYAAGIRIDPPVSVPRAWSHTPAPTRAADPDDDPPDVLPWFSGWSVMPYVGLTLPAAYSSRLVLQKSSAPAARSRPTTSASASAGDGTPTVEALLVTSPRMSMLSFTATGTPCS